MYRTRHDKALDRDQVAPGFVQLGHDPGLTPTVWADCRMADYQKPEGRIDAGRRAVATLR
jgi:hypothetical protein